MENTDFLTLAKTNELNLEIYNQQGRCAIGMNNAQKNTPTSALLDIPFPYGFVRASKAPIAQYHYQGVGQVFVVAGPLADKKDYVAGPLADKKDYKRGYWCQFQTHVLKSRPNHHCSGQQTHIAKKPKYTPRFLSPFGFR